MSQELPKIESFLNHYKASDDPVIQGYLKDLSRDRDQVLWHQALRTSTEVAYGDYLSSTHEPKRFIDEAKRRYDDRLFERVTQDREDLQALSSYQASCQDCAERHLNYIKRMMCSAALSPAVPELVALTGQDYAYQIITKHCVRVSDPTIAREAKALITLKTSDPRTFYERSAQLYDQGCRYPDKYQSALSAQHRVIAATVASQSSYLELRRHLEGAFVSAGGLQCSADYIDTARVRSGVSALTTKMKRKAREDRRRRHRLTEEQILASESLNEQDYCATLDREPLGLCASDQDRLWMRAYKVDSREYRALCKLTARNHKRCKRQVGARLGEVRGAYERNRLKVALKKIKRHECTEAPDELQAGCERLSERYVKRCSRTLERKVKRCERRLKRARREVRPVAPPVRQAPTVAPVEPARRVIEARPTEALAPVPVPAEEPPTLAPAVEEAPAPAVEEAPAPVVEEAPAPVVEEAPAPAVEETPIPVVEDALAPALDPLKADPALDPKAPSTSDQTQSKREEEVEELEEKPAPTIEVAPMKLRALKEETTAPEQPASSPAEQ